MSNALKDLTLRQLRAMAETIRAGNYTLAAERLGVTQPAITLQLQNLRGLAEVDLLQRTSEGIRPTEAGQVLLNLEERIRLATAEAIGQLESLKGLFGGTVRIGAVSTAKYFVPATIGAFARRYPKVELKLSIGNRAEIINGFKDFSLDIAITGRPPEGINLEKFLIGDHPHVIIAPPDHRLADKRGLGWDDLSRESFLMREQGSGTRLLMESHIAPTGFMPKIGMEIDSNETIKQAVMAGLGIAFLSGHTTASEVEQGRLVTLDVTGLPLMRQWFVVRRKDKHLMPPALALLDFMAREARTFLPGTA